MSTNANDKQAQPLTIICLASYHKGVEFMQEAKRQGCRVLLVTSASLEGADWPRESIDDIFYMPDEAKEWKMQDVLLGLSHLAKTERIDRIVPLDDFDVERAATLREHLRVPGMGDTTARYFRDKLAMRSKARNAGLAVPDFIHILNYDNLREFMDRVPAPWVLKPRTMAGSIGIKKMHNSEELWRSLDKLGDQQSFYLLERYVPGDIYHVDSIVKEKKVLFAIGSKYGRPPMDVSHDGDIFTTRTLPADSEESRDLMDLNAQVLKAFGLVRGVSHSEYIRGREDGKLYFLETSARVGGAHISDLVEVATGINMWAEWAKVEIAGENGEYEVPYARNNFAGLLVSLAKQEYPDTSAYNDPEVVWRLHKRHHVGLIVKSQDSARVDELMKQYAERMKSDFFAWAPPREKPSD